MRRALLRLVLGVVAVASSPSIGEAQIRMRDLVFTMGASGERYSGNFSAVTVPIVDSTENANAAVVDLGMRGSLALISKETHQVSLLLDGGLRQAAATGFRVRDYAPRVWVGSAFLDVDRVIGSFGLLIGRVGFATRSVQDRPPMPLFLQPGYETFTGSLGMVTRSLDGVTIDVQIDGGTADYHASELIPQLSLLDRRGVGIEAGARWGSTETSVRFFGGHRWTGYRHQGSFDPSDPFRRDRTIRAGLSWTHNARIYLQLGLEGTINRSNSNRPEYDAVSATMVLTVPLPSRFTLQAFSLLTAKSYVNETQFARLVPGEEADNASVAFLQIGRPLARNLDGALRAGWTRAETDIGNAYYQRFGLSARFDYRPSLR